ncbi:hypothetical protein GCM10023310_68820 [Paenibacillus vulneris]|uniref:Oxidoreductase n=1 Tax=Paenibacillus vulneris TaxID=1133364 RepID=A0ABW3UH83_9BACL
MGCNHCPFAFTDASEEFQNYGCLPSPWDIIQMKRKSGHNWACHENENKLCQGLKDHVQYHQENNCVDRMRDIDLSRGGLISYETWFHEGEEEAIKKANKTQISLGKG